MFKQGTRIVHKSQPNKLDNSWEVLSITDGKVSLGGPGFHESMNIIPVESLWDYVELIEE